MKIFGKISLLLALTFNHHAGYAARLLQTDDVVGLGNLEPADDVITSEVRETLEADGQTTVVKVMVATVLCDTLPSAAGADFLKFAIDTNETIEAERESYITVIGAIFDDGQDRHMWTGKVVDPDASEEVVPDPVNMGWSELCDPETFTWETTLTDDTGAARVLTTTPCSASGIHDICLVEVEVLVEDIEDPLIPDDPDTTGQISTAVDIPTTSTGTETTTVITSSITAVGNRRQLLRGESAVVDHSHRKLQDCTVKVSILYVFDDEAMNSLGVTAAGMVSQIVSFYSTTRNALAASDVAIDLQLTDIIHLDTILEDPADTLPVGDSMENTLYAAKNHPDIKAYRTLVEADLVQVFHPADYSSCGQAYPIGLGRFFAYSVVDPWCSFFQYAHSKLIGENLGATSIAGYQYCEDPGLGNFYTLMGTPCGLGIFSFGLHAWSNPDVVYPTADQPTGSPTQDNAGTLDDNAVIVANYEGPDVVACIPATPAPTPSPADEPPTPTPTPVPTPTPAPTTLTPTTPVPTAGGPTPTPSLSYTFDDCYADWVDGARVLTGPSLRSDDMTAEVCAEFCTDYPKFGTEFSNECFCGESSDTPDTPATGCTMACAGDPDEFCGGRNRISVYIFS